ncbi:MAG: AAA family ATPase [Patescibacteria group bacterium]
MPTKIILGFAGLLCSGKGTAAEYFKINHGATTYRFSTILRDLLHRVYLEESRDNMIRISECVRHEFGEDILSKAIAGDAAKDTNNLVIVEGIRRMTDIEHLAKLPNFILIEIFADPQKRYQRLVQRGENSDDKTKTYAQFLADHQRSTELSILDVIKHVQERIDNNGDKDKLHKQLDQLLTKYQ